MKPTTLNHPDAPDLNFKWDGARTISVRRFGRDVGGFMFGSEKQTQTREHALQAIDQYVKGLEP